MPTCIDTVVIDGDLFPAGPLEITILGMRQKNTTLSWAWVKHVGGAELARETSLVGRAAGGAVAAGVASLVTGPLGVIGAAALGSELLGGGAATEQFVIVARNGQLAQLRGKPGDMARVRALMEDAMLFLESRWVEQQLAEFAAAANPAPPQIEPVAESPLAAISGAIDAGLAMISYFGTGKQSK